MADLKPCAPAAQRNKHAILLALQEILRANDTVFEFGSGTGQHACHISAAMPKLTWQPSDLQDKLSDIQLWINESGCSNILPPIRFDLNEVVLPSVKASVCFSANTLHIVSWPLVEKMFQVSANILNNGGKLCIYGPFIFDGKHISQSNSRFDQQLRHGDSDSGIRDVVELQALARRYGFSNVVVIEMPANNHLLVWTLDKLRQGSQNA